MYSHYMFIRQHETFKAVHRRALLELSDLNRGQGYSLVWFALAMPNLQFHAHAWGYVKILTPFLTLLPKIFASGGLGK